MLKYEKMLHFDQHYEKLQEAVQKGKSRLTMSFLLLRSVIIYTVAFYLLRYTMDYIPDQCAWGNSKVLLTIGPVYFLYIDLLYFLGGLITICYGAIRLAKITYVNHIVREHDIPNRLLTDGFYARVRHPMYGTFVILYTGMLMSMRSRNGLILTILLMVGQYLNASMEEKKLHNLFGSEFMVYCKKTKLRMMTKAQIIFILVVIIFTLLGFVI